jgi:flavin-binding protein dodecin
VNVGASSGVSRDLMAAVLAARPAMAQAAQKVAAIATTSVVDAQGHVDTYA